MVSVVEHVQCPRVLIPLVEGDTHPEDILEFLEVVGDAASAVVIRIVQDIPLARPARVPPEIDVPSVGRYAAVRATSIVGSPRIVPVGAHVDPGPHTRFHGWDGGIV